MRRYPSFLLFIYLFAAWPGVSAAHEIPADATVQIMLRPKGHSLRMLVRVPLQTMRDVDFPARADGVLDMERLSPLLPDAARLWIAGFIDLHEGENALRDPRVVATQVSLESDQSFKTWDAALAHALGPRLSNATNVFWGQSLLDVLFEYPIASAQSEFSIHPRLNQLAARVVTVLRYFPSNGAVRAYEFSGDPGDVRLDPGWSQAAGRFIRMGFLHILDGTDHLLFLLCLVIPLRRFRSLVPVITAFTLAHSVTLIASAYNLAPDALWFPPLIETLIAVSIVWMALENIVGERTVRHRWLVAFGFGLIHGFGFSFVLRESLQFAGSHLLTSLLSFNVGVELGQLLVLLLLIPLLDALFRYVVAERMGTIILSAFVAHTGWHWMLDRADRLQQYRWSWPVVTGASLAAAMRWTAVISAAGWFCWMLLEWVKKKGWCARKDSNFRPSGS